MVMCPNCGKKSRDDFAYCRVCGSKLNGETMGDFSTDMLNVFRDGEEYLYLFCEKGNQVVLKAGSMDELAGVVFERQYPWEFRDWKGNVKHGERQIAEMPKFKTEFLKASALKEPEVIPTTSFKRKRQEDESYVPEYEVERVVDDSDEGFDDSKKESDVGFQSANDFVVNIEDVNFGKVMDRNITGCVPTVWGPDNSSRAINLRKSMFK